MNLGPLPDTVSSTYVSSAYNVNKFLKWIPCWTFPDQWSGICTSDLHFLSSGKCSCPLGSTVRYEERSSRQLMTGDNNQLSQGVKQTRQRTKEWGKENHFNRKHDANLKHRRWKTKRKAKNQNRERLHITKTSHCPDPKSHLQDILSCLSSFCCQAICFR